MSTVWLDGALLPAEEARISPTDRGFTLGDGLFETMRAYSGVVFRLDAHLARLERSAAAIGIPFPAGIADGVRAVLRASEVLESAVRITLTRGAGVPGLRAPADPRPTAVITATPFRPPGAQAEAGVSAIIARGRIDARSPTAGLKHLGYLQAILAQREADSAGADDAILLDSEGYLAEAAAANVFVVRGGVLLTPPLSCGILPGITRAVVLALAEEMEIEAREAEIPPDRLAGADEAFLTSSLREVVPLVRVSGQEIADGTPGAVTRRVQDAYRRLVLGEVGRS